MDPAGQTTLHLLCGRIAAAKSTLAARLAARPGTLLVAQDEWMSRLYPGQVRSIDDFGRLSARLREAMGPHLVAILRLGVSVVLDVPANTPAWRGWMRGLAEAAAVAHLLHLLDTPDEVCRARLRRRNAEGLHPYRVEEAAYDLFARHFVPPVPEEGMRVLRHGP